MARVKLIDSKISIGIVKGLGSCRERAGISPMLCYAAIISRLATLWAEFKTGRSGTSLFSAVLLDR